MITTTPIVAGILSGIMSCQSMEPPAIHMDVNMTPMQVDNTKSQEKLSKLREYSSSPHYGGKFPIVNGLTNSKVNLEYSMNFTISTNPLLKKSCIWIKGVEINMHYTPVVYIASQHTPGSCHYTQTYHHEVKHVNTAINTINDLAPYIQEVAIGAMEKWTSPEPIPTSGLEAEQQKISGNISTVLKKAMEIFERHMAVAQQKVDSIQEYERLSRTCLGRR